MNVLVVDDEASLLQLLGQHLVRQGYGVETAPTAAAAHELIGRAATRFDFALIDWTLPDGSGLDVAHDVLNRHPSVRVVFTSGYPVNTDLIASEVRSRVRVLQKPFLPRALGELLTNWA